MNTSTVLGVIKKSFATLDTTTLPLLYKSMVRHHLEYGNVIWGPHYKGDQGPKESNEVSIKHMAPIIRAEIGSINVTITNGEGEVTCWKRTKCTYK